MTPNKKIVKCTVAEDGSIGIEAMGLVDVPAIEQNWVALSDIKLSATIDERRMIYGPALIPNKYILRLDAQTNEEYYLYFDKPTVTAIAHQFFKRGLQTAVNIQHATPVDGVTIVESWVKEGPSDKSVQLGLSAAPDGTWYIGSKVDSDKVWERVKSGEIKGYSIEGLFNEVTIEMSRKVLTFEQELFLAIDNALTSVLG